MQPPCPEGASPCAASQICDDSLRTALCETPGCNAFGSVEAACGDATALCIGPPTSDDLRFLCARPCVAGSLDDCPTGQICTAFRLGLDSAGLTGCYPFCHGDGDCSGDYVCNTHTGQCSTAHGVDPDGTVCDPALFACQGYCIRTAVGPRCASLVDLRVTSACPDTGSGTSVAPAHALHDDVGFCTGP